MIKTSPSPTIVIFGITGDLSKRKLLPALYHLITHDLLSEHTRIIGTSRKGMDKDQLLKHVELCVLEAHNICDPVGIRKLHDALTIVKLDPSESDDYESLARTLDEQDDNEKRDRVLYMALPPEAYAPIITKLGEHKLNDERTRILIEKPFGYDTESATSLIDVIGRNFSEEQTYRIDHYLAKETAQNVLAFRLHNPIFSSLWNSQHIEKIHIRAAESIGIENRVEFYEKTGALRDIIQSHLIQLLAVVMMEQPVDASSESIHEGKHVFLRSLEPADPTTAVRGQYENYKDETDNPNSYTETYARIELSSKANRWTDTRIVLETGKAMGEKVTEVIVQFKHSHERLRNQLRFRIQPDEGISLDLAVKKPGFGDTMQHTELDFSYGSTFGNEMYPDAYERVIMDAIKADQSLFTSSDELMYAWNVVQPVIDAWNKDDTGLFMYHKGTKRIN